MLAKFAAHLDAIDAELVTIDGAVAWSSRSWRLGSVVPAMRLLVVRGFARYLVGPGRYRPPDKMLAFLQAL